MEIAEELRRKCRNLRGKEQHAAREALQGAKEKARSTRRRFEAFLLDLSAEVEGVKKRGEVHATVALSLEESSPGGERDPPSGSKGKKLGESS